MFGPRLWRAGLAGLALAAWGPSALAQDGPPPTAAAPMVLYDYDFVPGTGQLSQRGRDQVAKMAGLLATMPMPLVVERTPATPGLAEARRYAVLAELAGGPYPVGSERVVVGTSQ